MVRKQGSGGQFDALTAGGWCGGEGGSSCESCKSTNFTKLRAGVVRMDCSLYVEEEGGAGGRASSEKGGIRVTVADSDRKGRARAREIDSCARC